jgi:hypothetical protein
MLLCHACIASNQNPSKCSPPEGSEWGSYSDARRQLSSRSRDGLKVGIKYNQ